MTTVCILSHQGLRTNSGRHVLAIAKELAQQGLQMIAIFPDLGLNYQLEVEEYSCIQILALDELISHNHLVRSVDLYYFWTPRNKMSRIYSKICKITDKAPPYLVHLEDNDMLILMDALHISPAQLVRYFLGDEQNPMISLDQYCCPRLASSFLANALGITSLSKKLLEVLPKHINKLHFWPGFDCANNYEHSVASTRIRKKFSIASSSPIVAYTGNVHLSNVDEVRSLYIAIAMANRMGSPVTLVRTGLDYAQLFSGSEVGDFQNAVISLGIINQEDVFMLQAASKLLIQPGLNDEWNQCRVPSKLPEYFASSRPVILPCANVGQILTNGHNAIVLQEANASNIAKALNYYLPRRKDLDRIGLRGHLFAKKYLNWKIPSMQIAEFIQDTIAKRNTSCGTQTTHSSP